MFSDTCVHVYLLKANGILVSHNIQTSLSISKTTSAMNYLSNQSKMISMDIVSQKLESISFSSPCSPYLDLCSRFDGIVQQPPTLDCSFTSLTSQESSPAVVDSFHESIVTIKRWGSALPRRRCTNNLLELLDSHSKSSNSRRIPSYESGSNESWGYFVDTHRFFKFETPKASSEFAGLSYLYDK